MASCRTVACTVTQAARLLSLFPTSRTVSTAPAPSRLSTSAAKSYLSVRPLFPATRPWSSPPTSMMLRLWLYRIPATGMVPRHSECCHSLRPGYNALIRSQVSTSMPLVFRPRRVAYGARLPSPLAIGLLTSLAPTPTATDRHLSS